MTVWPLALRTAGSPGRVLPGSRWPAEAPEAVPGRAGAGAASEPPEVRRPLLLTGVAELLEAGEVVAARRLLASLSPGDRADPQVARWIAVLAPPIARPAGGPKAATHRIATWASGPDAAALAGRWVALLDDQVIADAPTRAELESGLAGLGEPGRRATRIRA